jgi:hypothetical protein
MVCTRCVAERAGDVAQVAPTVVPRTGTSTVFESARIDDYPMRPEVREALDVNLARRPGVLPGSDEETALLAKLDARREEAIEYDHMTPKQRWQREQARKRRERKSMGVTISVGGAKWNG